MASLLVIGGTGFFGKSILDGYGRGLFKEWNIDKVIIMARNPDKLREDVPELLSEGVELFTGDICTIDYLPYADYVIHAAASTDASKYLSQGEIERKNIISGALNYCRLAPLFHIDSKIVFCSSGAVYGFQPLNVECFSETMDFGDAGKLTEAKISYAYAKRDSEKAIQELGSEYRMNVSIARCFAFTGKYLPREQHFAIGNFIGRALEGKPIIVEAKNKVYRTYMHADDLSEWLMSISNAANELCPIYNVGSDRVLEIRDLAKKIALMFGVQVEMSEPDDCLINDAYVPCINKAKNELSLSLKFDLEMAVTHSQ